MGGHDHHHHHKPDPYSFKDTGFEWGTPIEKLPIYKGSLKRPLQPTANWRFQGPKPDGYKDVATELRLNYTYNNLWRTLDTWNFKSEYSAMLRRTFFKFGVICVGLFFIGCYGELNPYQYFAGHNRNGIRGPLVSSLTAVRPNRVAENTIVKDARFDERFGRTTTQYLAKEKVDLQ